MKDLSVLVDSMGEWTAEDSAVVHFDLAALGDSGLARWLSTATPLANKVKGISASHTKLTQANLMKLLSIALQDRVFLNLAYLDVSYCEIPEMAVNMLGEYLNPFSGGYNISILNLTRCKLGYYGSAKILESLYANSTLKELVLTGNLCTDKALPILHTGLTKYMNQIETIGLGSNSLTSAGIIFHVFHFSIRSLC